jgi:L-2-hydroxyglutarate oxidase LhgO
MRDEFDCAVIGAGVVGLAVARALALSGRTVLVLERHQTFGTEISSRNSEVIHAGIYYPPNSLKARLCVAGKAMLYRYCEERGVSHRRCGKLVVATSAAESETVQSLAARAKMNGVIDLVPLDKAQIRDLEPALRAEHAVFSPSSGIIDCHALMLSFIADAECHGTIIAYNSPVVGGQIVPSGFILATGEVDQYEIFTRQLINCSGLGASQVAASIRGLPRSCAPVLRLAKGNYFALTRSSPFSHLIYPVPEPSSLGIHVTLDMAGRARFGPDVEWIDEIDYSVSLDRIDAFHSAIHAYWPEIEIEYLQPAYAGIRPKLFGPGSSNGDFAIQDGRSHGISGFVNLLGIESPGLTASLAIAEYVRGIL